MESICLKFQFLDLSGVSNDDVQSLLEHLRPGNLISAVQLPWDVTKSKIPPEEEIRENDTELPSTFLPVNTEARAVDLSLRVTEIPQQLTANAPIFIPGAAAVPPLPANIGVPPSTFTGMAPQNMQQFTPTFLQRPPFSASAPYAPVPPLDSNHSNHVHHQISRRDSPTNRHHYQNDYDDRENNRGQSGTIHKGRHYSNDRHNPRKSKKKNHHLEGNAHDPMNMMEYGRVTQIMNEEALVVSDLSSPDRNMNAVAAPPANMLPMTPFPVTINHGHGTYQTPYQHGPPQVYFYHAPYGYMQQQNSPVLPNMSVVDGENQIMVANVTVPPPGLYEGSPLTMTSHAPINIHHHPSHNPQQHQMHHVQQPQITVQTKEHDHQRYLVDNSTIEIEPEAEIDSQSVENLTNDRFERETENVEIIPDECAIVNIDDPSENIEQSERNDENYENEETLSHEQNTESFECSEAKERTNTPDLTVNELEGVSETAVVENAPALAASPPKVAIEPPGKRWADLFKGSGGGRSFAGATPDLAIKPTSLANSTHNGHSNDDAFANDSEIQKIGKTLQSYKVDYQPQPFLPRGLINRSNWCYINATLQALLVCTPFRNLIKMLQSFPSKTMMTGKTPITRSLVKLMTEFENTTSKRKKNKEDLNIGQAFEPVCMHQMLGDIKSECIKGRQEDAEEFLSCILNGLHDEMVAIIKTVTPNTDQRNKGCNGQSLETNGHLSGEEGDEEWRMMGPKGKGSGTVTRASAHLSATPVKAIFGGMTRSLLTSGSESSATLQPFFTLQLDIQGDGVESVEDALNHLIVKEAIQGYTCSKTKKEVEASRCMTLEELPPVLILHFKRFVYDDKDGGSKKVLKKMDYPLDLELKKDLLSTGVRQRYSAKYHRNYRLFAVVYHDGKEAVKGHYVADVFHAGINGWLHCDDRNIKPVTESDVLTYNSPCVPYLLFYGRESQATITAANQATNK